MAETALQVFERNEKANKVRRGGFTPGIIYGIGIEKGIPVKLEMQKLKKLVKNNLVGARLQVKLGQDNKFCVIKDYQKDPVSGNIIHVDIQAVSEDEVIKLKIPVIYEGVASLEAKRLVLQVNVSDLEVEGKLNSLPESITIDVTDKKAGDKIVLKEIAALENLKVHADENEILAVVLAHKEVVEETPEAETADTADEENAGQKK